MLRNAGSALIGAIALTLSLNSLSCSSASGTGPGAHDPVRMSQSEYDIARDLWLRRNQPREALAHALKAVELDDSYADAAHLVALLYLDFCSRGPGECRLSEAEKHARLAISDKPDFREAKNTLAVVLIHEKRYADAIAVLKPLTEDILYETPENAWGNLGWAYLEQGSFDLAIDALKRSVAAQPLFCVGSFRLGLAFEHKQEFTSALDAFTRALETDAPGCNSLQEAFAGRARVRMKLGDPDSAKADLDRCVTLSGKTDTGKECSSMLQNFK
jgi:type IV pilus assembly protein PilF